MMNHFEECQIDRIFCQYYSYILCNYILISYCIINMKIIPLYFLISICIGFIILYLIYPKPEIILLYPSVNNSISDTYVDDNNVCYKYHRKQVSCLSG